MEGVESFDDVTELMIEGGGDITLSENGMITGALKASKSGGTLKLTGPGGITFTSGGMSVSGMTFNNYSSNQGSNQMFINGKLIDLNRLDEITVKEGAAKTFKLGQNCLIKAVKVRGSASIRNIPPQFVDNIFNASVEGSGDIYLPAKSFKSLNISIAGSGDVRANTITSALQANIVIAGSGDVSDIHILDAGAVNVMGSGDVRITAVYPNQVSRNVMGSGDIQITRLKY